MRSTIKVFVATAAVLSVALVAGNAMAATGSAYPKCTDENKELAEQKTQKRCEDLCYNNLWGSGTENTKNLCPCFDRTPENAVVSRLTCVSRCTQCLTESAVRGLCGPQCSSAGTTPIDNGSNPSQPPLPLPGGQAQEQCLGGCVYKGSTFNGYCIGVPGGKGWDYVSECAAPNNNFLCYPNRVTGKWDTYRKPQCRGNQNMR